MIKLTRIRTPKNPCKDVIVCRYTAYPTAHLSGYIRHNFGFYLLRYYAGSGYGQRLLLTLTFQSNKGERCIYGGDVQISLCDYRMYDTSIKKILKEFYDLDYSTSGHNRGYTASLSRALKRLCYFKYSDHEQIERVMDNWGEIEKHKAEIKRLGGTL